jgi:hypothetical protein
MQTLVQIFSSFYITKKGNAMDRTESLGHFEKNYVQGKIVEKILQAESHLLQHREELAAEFRESLRLICQKIQATQIEETLAQVGFINYSLLRSAILEKRPQYRIDVYNQDWYFSPNVDAGLHTNANCDCQMLKHNRQLKPECSGEYDGSRILRFLDELVVELEEPRKLYFDRVTIVDLEQIKLREAAKFNQLIISLADYALRRGESLADLAELTKAAEFEIRVGEYYDASEVVCKEDRREKDSEETKEWLEDQHEDQYVAAFLRNLDLSGGDYRGLDLRWVDCSGSKLTGSNFANSLLIKARFHNCLLSRANFSGAAIHDVDFSGANLSEAVLCAATGAKGMARTMAEGIYSVWGVDFSGANLEGADFRHANLQGANFTGAKLANAVFYGAKLDEAIFDQTALPGLNLDATQTKTVIWVG